jgi:hypothetical protein
MTLRADSYGTTGEVKAFTRHLLDGQAAFNSTTRPTGTELEKFLDRASGVLNISLWNCGFAPSAIIANSTAKLMCDDWVVMQAVKYVELTQRGTGYSDAEGSRIGAFNGLYKSADNFVSSYKLGLQRDGVSQAYKLSDGLQFTGLDAVSSRSDPSDESLAQPMFVRNQFEFPKSNADSMSGGNGDDGPDL